MRPIAIVLLLALTGCGSSSSVPGDASQDLLAPDAGLPDAAPPDATPDAAPRPDVFVPFKLEVTVNEIPVAMNGSAPFTNLAGAQESFALTVPRHGFTVDALYRGSLAQPSTLELTADVALGSLAPGTNLADKVTLDKGRASFKVPASLALPVGPATFSAKMSDGSQTLQGQVSVNAADKTFLLDPFRIVDPWLLVFSQDLYTVNVTKDAAGKVVLNSTATPNGIPDFDEDLRAIGFGTKAMLPACAATKSLGVTGTNAIVRTWVQQEILATLREVFHLEADGTVGEDSVGIAIYVEGSPGAPSLTSFKQQELVGGETTKGFSAIAVGGGDTTKAYLGMSLLDERNLRNELDVGPSYGVFTTRAIGKVFEALETDAFVKMVAEAFFGAFVPELGKGGTRVGEDALDATILASGFDPKTASAAAADRYDKLKFLVETLGRLAGALVAHEMGHSLGLVANGPPPHGLFGGEANAAFVNPAQTTSHHIDTPGFNLMEAGPGSAGSATFNVAQYLTPPRFNELNLAYLRGRVLLLPK